jgi:hypothetical protein
VFDLNAPPQAAFDALKHLALDEPDEDLLTDATRDSEHKLKGVRFNWKKRGNKKHAGWDNTVLGWIEIDGTRLIAEVNSKARADAIRKKIETALGAGIRYRASEIQSPERMLADLRAAGTARGGAASEESERLAELPEVREKISEMMTITFTNADTGVGTHPDSNAHSQSAITASHPHNQYIAALGTQGPVLTAVVQLHAQYHERQLASWRSGGLLTKSAVLLPM